jgi:hypothetical protein
MGSSPFIPTISLKGYDSAPIAQLDRAFDYGSKGCGFDSCWARHFILLSVALKTRDVAQLGSALDLGSRGRRFESCHPDQFLIGGIAQLARALGSYPGGRGFESHSRYQLFKTH